MGREDKSIRDISWITTVSARSYTKTLNKKMTPALKSLVGEELSNMTKHKLQAKKWTLVWPNTSFAFEWVFLSWRLRKKQQPLNKEQLRRIVCEKWHKIYPQICPKFFTIHSQEEWKASLNPLTALWRCEDQPKCHHSIQTLFVSILQSHRHVNIEACTVQLLKDAKTAIKCHIHADSGREYIFVSRLCS